MKSHVSTTVSCVFATAAMLLLTSVGHAEPEIVGLAPQWGRAQMTDLSVRQARAQFEERGYEVGPSTRWSLHNVTTFSVTRAGDSGPFAPMLTVLVYDDFIDALIAREESEASGYPLVGGFGKPTWQGNIAMVQSNLHELGRYFQAQVEQDYAVVVRTNESAQTATTNAVTAVNPEFAAVLDGATWLANF